ncbi:Leucine-rich repeat-containing protein 4C [Pseudolycoriella hygida]|uniref:Leucine-rich repeat-containing protein 4C n=1 Tax=Pseudolycoriella hygida TaxID=35572 RepID=A0A9Q0S1H8_9DIPT|nr:Leucine-rich repeat-containing protein 4C [Pseudolycoriella hygida]
MTNLKRIFITTSILLTLVVNTRGGCTWTGQATDCVMECTSSSETVEQVMTDLERKYKERRDCDVDGVSLTLRDGMVYPNFILKANWFTAAVKVKELTFFMKPVTTVEINAFTSDALTTVKKLVLKNFNIAEFVNGSFNGLESVEVLILESATITVVEKGVLDVMCETLQELQIIQWGPNAKEAYIDGFTGSKTMTSLKTVKINYKINSTLTHRSFVGLRNVKTLDLSDCQIESIGPGTFDPIGGSVRELNLKNNKIKTLPEGIFSSMLPSEDTRILLESNAWHCDCDLMPLKICISENSNLVGPFKCTTPTNRKNQDIVNTEFCDDYIPPPTTSTTTTTTTSTAAPTTGPSTPEEPEDFTHECYEAGETEQPKTVTIQKPRSTLTANENENGDVTIHVETLNENSVLIWFASPYKETSKTSGYEINCLFGTARSTPIPDLMEHTVYTFCLMDSVGKTVSPLDCISYTKRDNCPQPWLFQSSKGVFIGVAVVAYIVSLLSGVAIGVLALEKALVLLSERKQKHRISAITKDNESTKSKTNLDHRDTVPPLPTRPYSLEEPIYDVVMYTENTK